MIRPLWESRWITNMGAYHRMLEELLKERLEVPGISLMVNGHMSLELAIQAMGFPRGAEVITTPFTFISTTHAIIRNGLCPVFCDIKPDGTIDENKIEDLITEKTAAIVPVHVYGNICNVEEIQRIADKYSLKVIYDAAHAFGETRRGIGVGSFGDASVFSFHATKVFNTIEGGAVCFRDHGLYDTLYNLKNFGIRGEEMVVSIGANAKMNEFSAAMGLCNLKYFDQEVEKRRIVAEHYLEFFREMKGIRVVNLQDPQVQYNYSYFPVRIEEELCGYSRDDLYEELKRNQIFARKYFYPLTADQACFKNKFRDVPLPKARLISGEILTLPLYGDMTESHLARIFQVWQKF